MHISEIVQEFKTWLDARQDYAAYLESDGWKHRANQAKARAGYRCQLCNRTSNQVTLNTHHRTYENLGHERADDLTVLCEDCHHAYEEHRKKNARELKRQSIERMMQVARRKRNDRRVLGQLVRELQELELPETQYRQVREQITEIFEGER